MKNNRKDIHLFLDNLQYKKLKTEAKLKNQTLSDLIRNKIEIGSQNEDKIIKYLNQQLENFSNKINLKFNEIKTDILSLHKEFLINLYREIETLSNNQKSSKESLKLIAFYSVYSTLFSTLKWQNLSPEGQISWEAVKEKREIWKKKADEIVEKILGEKVLHKILK